MMDLLNMLWIVLCFWFLIEAVNSRLNRSRNKGGLFNQPNSDK